jgi:hypothetical protein
MSSNLHHQGQSKSGGNPTQPQTSGINYAMLGKLTRLEDAFKNLCVRRERLLSEQTDVVDRLQLLVARARHGLGTRQSGQETLNIVGGYRHAFSKLESNLESMRQWSFQAEEIARAQGNVLVEMSKEQNRREEGNTREDN